MSAPERQPPPPPPGGGAADSGRRGTSAAGLSEATLKFLHESSVARGPSLKAQVVMTLGALDNRPQGELIAALAGQIPAELVPEGSNGRRGLVLLALAELETERRISRLGRHDEDAVQLVPAHPTRASSATRDCGCCCPTPHREPWRRWSASW